MPIKDLKSINKCYYNVIIIQAVDDVVLLGLEMEFCNANKVLELFLEYYQKNQKCSNIAWY